MIRIQNINKIKKGLMNYLAESGIVCVKTGPFYAWKSIDVSPGNSTFSPICMVVLCRVSRGCQYIRVIDKMDLLPRRARRSRMSLPARMVLRKVVCFVFVFLGDRLVLGSPATFHFLFPVRTSTTEETENRQTQIYQVYQGRF